MKCTSQTNTSELIEQDNEHTLSILHLLMHIPITKRKPDSGAAEEGSAGPSGFAVSLLTELACEHFSLWAFFAVSLNSCSDFATACFVFLGCLQAGLNVVHSAVLSGHIDEHV
jgi:hypothetical protein